VRAAAHQQSQMGERAKAPVSDQDTGLFWVANDNTVRRLQGYTGQTVSNAAVERAILNVPDKTKITCTGYVVPGHSFLTVSAPGLWTWELDVNTGLWHERTSYGMPNWRCSQVAKFSALGAYVAVDDATGQIYTIDPNAQDEAGNPMVWTLRALARTFPNRMQGDELYLNVIPGTGLNTTDADEADPKITIEWSPDNGATFPHSRQLSTGKIGERFKRVRTRRLGLSDENGWLFQVSMSAGVVKGLTGGMLDGTVLKA